MEEDEEKKKVDEETTTPTEADGAESEADIKIKQLNADTERINKAIAENENAKARQKLGGVSEAGQTPVVKEETDEDKAKAFEKGEVDLLAK